MKCPKCNNPVPEGKKVCIYCGKKFDKPPVQAESKPPEKKPEGAPSPDNGGNVFDGVQLSPSSIDLPASDDSGKESIPGLIANHEDIALDDVATQVEQAPQARSGSGEDLPDLLFEESDNDDSIADMITANDIVPSENEPKKATGLYGNISDTHKGPESKWEETPENWKNQDAGGSQYTREIIKEVRVKESSNALVGYVVIMLCLFFMIKSGFFFLDKYSIINNEFFTEFIWPGINLVQEIFLLAALWLIAVVTKPWSLKFLALMFSLLATAAYGAFVYFQPYFAQFVQ